MGIPYTGKRNKSTETDQVDTGGGVEGAPSLAEVAISAKSLTPRQQDRVRAALTELRAAHPNQTELARLLGVKQQTVSTVLKGGTVGVKMATRIAEARGQTYEELIGGAPRPRTYADVDGWAEAAETAVSQGLARRYVIRSISTWAASLPVPRVELHLLLDLAALWVKWAPLEMRLQAETAEAAEDMVAQDTRAGEVKTQAPRRGRSRS